MATGTQAKLKPAPASSTRSRTAMKSRTAAKAVPTTAAASQQPSHQVSKTRAGLKPPPATAAQPKVTMKTKTVAKPVQETTVSAHQASRQDSTLTQAARKHSATSANAEALVWARERYGLSQDEAARKMRIKTERLADWESGDKEPTNLQIRRLAEIYERHPLELVGTFIRPAEYMKSVPDYRLLRSEPNVRDRKRLSRVQEWAEETHLNAIDLFEELDEEVPALPSNLRFSTNTDAERAAEVARDTMSFPLDKQLDLPSSENFGFPEILRQNIEDLGVLVLKSGELAQVDARGLCLFQEPLPVIVFCNESSGAQAFTLAHLLGHVLLGSSGIIGEPVAGAKGKNSRNCHPEEVWCNKFAAAFLVPKNALADICERPNRPMAEFDLKLLSKLSRWFAVSDHAMAIRLVSLGYVGESFYWKILRPVLLAKDKERKGGGRPMHPSKRYVGRMGRFYTCLVISAWNADLITMHNACEYMDIKNMQHLADIRENAALRL